MNKLSIILTGVLIAMSVSCSAVPTISTKAPTNTPMPQADTPTPRPESEWALERISVQGETVIVSIFFLSTPSIEVTLSGNPPTSQENFFPTMSFIFEGVGQGEHLIEFRDTMGNVETTTTFVE